MSYRDRIEELYMKQKQLFALVVLLGGCFAALADDPRPEIKLTGIVCFRGTCYALGEATSSRPYAAPQRPILQPGEKFDGLEILSIDEKKGIVTFRHNNETQRLTLAQGDTPESPLGQTFNLKAADSSQLLEVYQELAGRTVLRSPVLPGAKIDLRSDGALSTQAAQEALVQAFATKSIALVPKDKKFAFAVPKSAEARLQTIPPELYDAARVDGASAVRQFFHVTLPQLRNVLLIVLLLRGIWMFTKFDVPWLLGFGGGAGEAIRTLPVFTYQRSFTYYQAGMGAALSNVMFALLLMVVTIYFIAFPPSEEENDA